MDRVIRQPVRNRNTALACLFAFVLIAVFSGFAALDAPSDRPYPALILIEIFWLFLIAAAALGLASYYRERLEVDDDRIIKIGIRATRVIAFSDVVELKWRCWPSGGSVVLRSNRQRIAFELESYEPADRLFLISCLRTSMAEGIQLGWPKFCHSCAVRLFDLDQNREPRAGEMRITRTRYDRFFLPATLIASITGALAAWGFNRRDLLVAPVPFVVGWLLLRVATPRKGCVERRLTIAPNDEGSVVILLANFVVLSAVGMVLLSIFPQGDVITWTLLGCLFAGAFVQIAVESRRRNARARILESESMLRWDATLRTAKTP